MKKAFCEYCFDTKDCFYEEKMVKETIDDIEIEYLEKNYICECCGNIVFDEELWDYNVHEANNKIREKTGIITTYEIDEILKKYDIGKKPLAKVLNMGEVNILRYLDGRNPSKELSDRLKLIKDNPFVFEMMLIDKKDEISSVAFKKSLGKVKQLELTDEHSKIYNIGYYILKINPEKTNLALQKVIYFVDGISNFLYGNRFSHEKVEAWKYGPVYRELYDAFAYFGGKNIDLSEVIPLDDTLSEEEKKLIDAVMDSFGCYSADILREMSHLTDPWIKAREGLEEDENSSRIIEEKDIEEYFNKVGEKYDIKSVDDIHKYSEALYRQVIENKTS